MKIRDFHITGQYPTLSVETEIEDSSKNQTVRLDLGPWNYVSLLNEQELKSLVHLVYERERPQQKTQAMKALAGSSLEVASNAELP